jgi:hypothetical protein
MQKRCIRRGSLRLGRDRHVPSRPFGAHLRRCYRESATCQSRSFPSGILNGKKAIRLLACSLNSMGLLTIVDATTSGDCPNYGRCILDPLASIADRCLLSYTSLAEALVARMPDLREACPWRWNRNSGSLAELPKWASRQQTKHGYALR